MSVKNDEKYILYNIHRGNIILTSEGNGGSCPIISNNISVIFVWKK